MNSLLKKLLTPRHREYIEIDRNLTILDTSFAVKRFADAPKEVAQGKDIRLGFPELIGVEDILLDVLEGHQDSFELKAISRPLESQPFYFDLYTVPYKDEETEEDRLVIIFEDVTEMMVLEQTLVQRSNEASLLLSALTISKNYTDKIIASMANALLVTNQSGIIKTVNQAAQEIFGYSETELIKQPISILIKDEQLLPFANPGIELSEAQTWADLFQDIEVVCYTKTRAKVIVAFSCSVIQADHQSYDFVYIGQDITERKRVELEIRKALAQEKELNELKSRFVSMTSHEFRTPLSVILLGTELLTHFGDTAPVEKKREYLRRIRSATQHMIRLLDDVLTIGKAEAGSLSLVPTAFDLVQFCETLVSDLQTTVSSKQTIDFIHSSPHLEVYLDDKVLRQILSNLLSNALKYSPTDSTIRFELTHTQHEAIFEIQDQGIGIPPADQLRLFEPFHRATNVGNIAGTGLGLAIVQRSVELQGGRIMVSSEPGVGTTFRVTIPLITSQEKA